MNSRGSASLEENGSRGEPFSAQLDGNVSNVYGSADSAWCRECPVVVRAGQA